MGGSTMATPEASPAVLVDRGLWLVVVCVICSTMGSMVSRSAGADYPPRGTVLFPGVSGVALQDSLRVNFRPPIGLTYAGARDIMYTQLDNHDGQVTCVYTGFTIALDPQSSSSRDEALRAGINAEHTWPQSKGAENRPMQADLHHLFPSEINANGVRGNHPFGEIPDNETDSWYINLSVVSTPDPLHRDDYSEFDGSFPGGGYTGRWEPREVHEGNVARAMFYFWTVYRAEASAEDPLFFGEQKDAFRQWALVDTVDQAEYTRTCGVADVQSGRYNPFVIDPTLVDRAYFDDVPVVLASFEVSETTSGVVLTWETGAERDHLGFNVIRAGVGGDRVHRSELRLNDTLLSAGPHYEFLDRTGAAGGLYDYWLEAIARDGSIERFGPHRVTYPDVAPEAVAHPPRLTLGPNPFRLGSRLRLAGETAHVSSIELFDVGGRLLPVPGGSGPTGNNSRMLLSGWDGRLESGEMIQPGLYFIRVRTGDSSLTFRLVVIR